MTTQKPNPLLEEIEAFLAETGMGVSYFGKKAANDSNLVQRLRAGKTPKGREVFVRPYAVQSIKAFMRAERRKREREVA